MSGAEPGRAAPHFLDSRSVAGHCGAQDTQRGQHNARNDPEGKQDRSDDAADAPGIGQTAPVRIHLARVNLLQISRAQDPRHDAARPADDQAQDAEYENKGAPMRFHIWFVVAFGIITGFEFYKQIFAS